MGVEAWCCPYHSTADCWHMKRQPSLYHHCPCRGRHHWDCHCNLCCCCQLCHHCQCRGPLLLLSAVAVVVPVDHCCRRLCCVAVSHRQCHCCQYCPCYQPLPSLSPSAITVAISIGYHCHHCHQPFLRLVALARQELYSNNWSKECLPYFILFGQWAALSSMPDVWPDVKRQWSIPVLGGMWQAVSG